jgi:hypothetical protein
MVASVEAGKFEEVDTLEVMGWLKQDLEARKGTPTADAGAEYVLQCIGSLPDTVECLVSLVVSIHPICHREGAMGNGSQRKEFLVRFIPSPADPHLCG